MPTMGRIKTGIWDVLSHTLYPIPPRPYDSSFIFASLFKRFQAASNVDLPLKI